MSWIVDSEHPFTIASLEGEVKDQQEWWDSFIGDFLRATSRYFSQPYTVQHIQRIVRHRLESKEDLTDPIGVCCVPQRMEFAGGVMYVDWVYETIPVGIHIPVEDHDTAELPAIGNGKAPNVQGKDEIVEWDVDAVPMTSEECDVQDGAKVMDKHRVREARLKAKVAVYRAQYQMNRFYDKYGDEVSDSDSNATSEAGSGWGDEEEEDEEDEDEDEEDV